MTLDPRIEHLSAEQLDELMMEYYSGEKPGALIKKYKIKVPPSLLYSLFPPLKLNEKCPYCDVQLEQKMASYSAKTDKPASCPKCNHVKDDASCSCENCIKKYKEKERRFAEEVKEKIKNKTRGISQRQFIELTPLDAIYLAALLRACLESNGDRILPYIDMEKIIPLTPYEEWDFELIKYLIQEQFIYVHPSSTIKAFKFDEMKEIESFRIDKVHYHINIAQGDLCREDFIDLLSKPKQILTDTDFCLEMWLRLAKEDCYAYLIYNLEKVHFPFPAKDKAMPVIEFMLKHFSTATVYYIIYKHISSGTRYYQENDITPGHATNIVLSGCKRYVEKAVSQSWNITEYSRIVEIPESALMKVFFYRVLELREQWFHTPISYDYIAEQREKLIMDYNKQKNDNNETMEKKLE